VRTRIVILITGTLMACGGSQDVCQEAVSIFQSESNKIQSCGGDDSTAMAELATLQSAEPSCEASLKNCTAAELSAVNSYLSCLQQTVSNIQCQWFTEADAATDPSYVAWQNSVTACETDIANVSPTCGGANP